MASCVELVQGINPSCEALNKVGGVKKRVWIGQLNQISAYSLNASGYINTISMANDPSGNPYELKKFIGRKSKNSIKSSITAGDNINTFKQEVMLMLYHFTPEDREAIESLVNADDLFVIAETESGQIEVLGIDEGLNCSAGEGGSGVNLQDNTAFSITLGGEQRKLPYLFDSGSGLSGSKTYLDGLSS